jgi:hypothetical protein
MDDYPRAAARLTAWLDAHFDMDGRCLASPDEARFYPKAPYLLQLAGLRTKAAAAARFAFEHFIDACGDMVSEDPLENRVYDMGWLLLGAVGLEQFGLAGVLADRLCQLQDTASGGVMLPDADAGEEAAEVCFSGCVGMALVAAGRLPHAQRLADRLIALLAAQPDERRFYNRFRRDGTVIERPAAGAWDKVYDLDQEEQRPASFATVVNALVWVARATRRHAYLAAARRYVDLVYSHRLDPAHFGRATKFGWAMLNLRQDTGDEDLLARARQLGDVLVEQQCPDGLWDPRPGGNSDVPAHVRLSYSSDCAMTVLSLAQLR